MPERLICPNCNKASYTAAPDSHNPCPYCGFLFSRQDSVWFCKRSEQRFHWVAQVNLFNNGSTSEYKAGKTEDISQSGIKIRYSGEKLIPGDMINISIKDLETETAATVIWSKDIDETECHSGIRCMREVRLPFNYGENKPVFSSMSILKEFYK